MRGKVEHKRKGKAADREARRRKLFIMRRDELKLNRGGLKHGA